MTYERNFRLAALLKMSVRECRQKHTHREYNALIAHLDSEWNKPSRSDYYLMQIALEIRRFMMGFSKEGKAPEMGDLILSFSSQRFESELEKEVTPEEIKVKAEISKAVWFARTGQLPESRKKP